MNQTNVTLSKEGRVIIPADIRQLLGVSPGDQLAMRVVDGELILSTQAVLLKRLRDLVGPSPKGELMSEQLIRERREEAADE